MTFEEEERKRLNEYYEKNKKRIFQDMSLEEQEDFWKDFLDSSKEDK